jgi:hypothetical protein
MRCASSCPDGLLLRNSLTEIKDISLTSAIINISLGEK